MDLDRASELPEGVMLDRRPIWWILAALLVSWNPSMESAEDAPEATSRLFMQCRPPVRLVGKPIVARYSVSLGVGGALEAVYERDAAGNSRTELRQPKTESPLFARLWSVKDEAETLVFYLERTYTVRRWKASR